MAVDGPRLTVWFARRPGPGGTTELAAVIGDRHPNRTIVDEPPEVDALVLYHGYYDSDGEMTRAVVQPMAAPLSPDLWYVEQPEPDADPPATSLLAFATPEFEDGTIVGTADWQALGADPREQVAALRWWTGTGQVHQVYVAPQWRRRGIASKLVLVGAASTVGRRWPSLWGTGELTDLGDAWIRRAVWRSRVDPRTRTVPPMTPPEDAVGVPPEHLRPDDSPDD